jgi:hypothetical protein
MNWKCVTLNSCLDYDNAFQKPRLFKTKFKSIKCILVPSSNLQGVFYNTIGNNGKNINIPIIYSVLVYLKLRHLFEYLYSAKQQ